MTAGAGSSADAPASGNREAPAEHEVPGALALAAEFDAVMRNHWGELVAGALRKAGREKLPDPVWEALSPTAATGARVAAPYTADDAANPPAVGAPVLVPFVCVGRTGGDLETDVSTGWDVRQPHEVGGS